MADTSIAISPNIGIPALDDMARFKTLDCCSPMKRASVRDFFRSSNSQSPTKDSVSNTTQTQEPAIEYANQLDGSIPTAQNDEAKAFQSVPVSQYNENIPPPASLPQLHSSNNDQCGQEKAFPDTTKQTPRGLDDFRKDENSLDTARDLAVTSTLAANNSHADLVFLGMGPASLAIGIALADELSKLPKFKRQMPLIRFLERQTGFAWHPGMQIAEAKMQISFLKDLATPRDPTSPFSFVNYLHKKGRFSNFLNLGTFLPSRWEYQDYMRWCAEHFTDAALYNSEVRRVTPQWNHDQSKVVRFSIEYVNLKTNETRSTSARHIVIATGGKPNIPKKFHSFASSIAAGGEPRIAHSSHYATTLQQLHNQQPPPARFAIVGSGQSAAEIFQDLCMKYPNGYVTLICRADALKPSDDSPFVNEIFDPERVDTFFGQTAKERAQAVRRNKATNYSVVRPELIDQIYHAQYVQKLKQPDERLHKHKLLFSTDTTQVRHDKAKDCIELELEPTKCEDAEETDEIVPAKKIIVDQIFLATGYVRNTHEEILKGCEDLVDQQAHRNTGSKFPVRRDYSVAFDQSKVDSQAGVWLQGCNEATHGISDSLLSILAVRGGELVDSIFGQNLAEQKQRLCM